MTPDTHLRDFQVAGSLFLQERDVALLCDDAGLGKSAEVLDAADKLGVSRVLCIGPAVAGVSWPLQIKQWSPRRKFVNLDLGTQFGFDLPGFYFVSYDILARPNTGVDLANLLSACAPWDLIVLDEAQYIKNPEARRTKAVYGDVLQAGRGIVANTTRVWVLSGTLAPNHAGEVYTHLRRLLPRVLMKIPAFHGRPPEQHEFEDQYCHVRDTVYGRQIDGSKNQRELKAALKPHILRRRKLEVMRELPPMEFFTAPLNLPAAPVNRMYAPALDGWVIETAMHPTLSDSSITQVINMSPHIATVRHELGLAKVPACIDWCADRLDAGEPKLIVFAHHSDVLARLYAGLEGYDPVLFHGRTPTTERAEAVDRFQTDPQCRVFVGQIVAAGTAITLTAAKTVFFAEFASTPGVNYQASSRAHRMGQRDGVQVYFGTVPDSLDERIARTAARRARDIAELFD